MNPQLKFTLIGVLIGALFAFGGNFVLLLRSQSHQRKQWILDNKKSEWRELISTLCRSARSIMHNHPWGVGTIAGPQAKLADAADDEARMVIQDRLSIADVMRKENVFELWDRGIAKDDVRLFWADWKDLHATLVKAARKDLGLKDKG
jgi:hypothetical protein